MLAVGPVAILPSPIFAAVPNAQPFTPTSGTATWNAAGNTGTINASNRAVLEWGNTTQVDTTTLTNFYIAAGETFNFVLPSGGAVLNRVSAGTNTTAAGVAAAAIINGTLLSNGQVFVLANGNIVVGTGAQISTASGLVLSTLDENNFNFTANGNLALNGASQGAITLGTGTGVANVIGNLAAHAGTVTTDNLTVSGDFILNQKGSGGLVLTTTHALNVGGNFTATSNNGAISQGTGALIVANGNTSLSSGTGAVTLDVATNDFQTLSVNTSGTGGDVSIRDANIISLGASTLGGDLTVRADGTGGKTAIATTGTLSIGGNATFIQNSTDNSAINIGNNSTVAGVLSLGASNSTVTFSGLGNITLGNASATPAVAGASITAGKNSTLTVTTNGVLNINGNVDVAGATDRGSISLTGGSIVQAANITATGGNGTISFNATSGNITLANVTNSGTGGVSIRTAGGNVTQASGTVITTSNLTGTSTINVATGTANLSNANAFAAGTTLQITANSATVNNTGTAGALQIGTTNVTNNLTINNDAGNNSVVLGVGTGTGAQNITVGGNLTVTVAGTGTITDGDYSDFSVGNGLNLTTGATGSVTLDAAVVNGSLAPTVQFGQVKINTGGAATIAEGTTLNLGDINAVSLNATSVGGSIINTGNVNVGTGGTATFNTSGAATSVITNGTNTIGTVNFVGSGGAVTVANAVTVGATTNVTTGDDLTVTTTNSGGVTLAGPAIGGSLTINSSGTIVTTAGTNTTVGGNLSLMAADTGATSITQGAAGRFVVNGVTEVASAGNVVLTEGNDFIGGVVLNQAGSTGKVEIYDLNNLLISGTAGGLVDVRAGASSLAIDNAWNLTLGNLSVGSLRAEAVNGGGGNSGTLTQASGSALHVEGDFRGVTRNANIVLNNSGNSAGRVEFFTNGGTNNGSGTISYTEAGTIRLGNVASNSTITLRSNFGSVIEDTANDTEINARATLNVTAPNGSILIGGTSNTTTTTTANVATFIASAPNGSVAVLSNNSITLGAINANSLTVTASNNITQSAALKVFGVANFTSTAAGAARNITLTNNANNFGPVSISLGNNTGTIAVTEGGTLNLRSVSMVGGGNSTFTATSLNGDIIDTGFGGVRLGGNATSTGSGVVTLTATNGNITLDDPSSDIATSSGLVFNAKDVALSVLGNATTSLVLGAASTPSQATGNLSVTNLLGSIGNAGAFTVGGTAFFQTPSNDIIIGQPGVGFGTLKFIGRQVSISEAGNMDIATGSSASGAANLVSGGSISITNVGGGLVTFANTINLTAAGDITPGSLLQAGGQLRVTHTGTANLGGLSINGNLNSITPIDAGTGPYIAPQP